MEMLLEMLGITPLVDSEQPRGASIKETNHFLRHYISTMFLADFVFRELQALEEKPSSKGIKNAKGKTKPPSTKHSTMVAEFMSEYFAMKELSLSNLQFF
mmetsp:Transcript_113201/g.327032  ORF Transcript_113201/g.327032 Transcript_113201/m.327032 type:complete len:100 (-) Transcript_113201:23-322(-)